MARLKLLITMGAACVILSGCGEAQKSGASASAPAELTAAQKTALLAELPAPYNAGDIANGETRFMLCRSCHTTGAGGASLTGPNLHAVFGRKAATLADYRSSDALKASGLIWDAPTMDAWVADPHALVKGSKMSFVGLKEVKDRVDLIAYLKVETSR